MAGTPDVRSPPRARTVPAARGRRRAPVLVAALVTTVWASILSYALVLAAVALVAGAAGHAVPVPEVLRSGTAGWLLAHGVPVVSGSGRLDLAPLAVSV
ncbi:MAG TPA: hypothetical protein VJT31_15675, partial [Rugosimonospora sp.]|nr:hypothetical protein [Rugosimonospora sp.]